MVEHGTENAGVDSSSLSLGTTPTPYPFPLPYRCFRDRREPRQRTNPLHPVPTPYPLTLSRSKGAPHLDNPRPLMFQ